VLDLARGVVVRPIVASALAVRADMGRWDRTREVMRLDAQLAEIVHDPDRKE
jgi:hypothetical protein